MRFDLSDEKRPNSFDQPDLRSRSGHTACFFRNLLRGSVLC
jgi:hypothetical protein